MEYSTQGRILVYDDNKTSLNSFADLLHSHNLQMYGTDNLYKLIRYSDELKTDAVVLSIHDNSKISKALLEHWDKHPKKYPLILLKPHSASATAEINPLIAHYITAPIDINRLLDILESYSIGYKKHRIMLLSAYNPKDKNFCEVNAIDKSDCFEVHNESAAEQYLHKNSPEMVFVEHTPPFISARHHFNHPHVFYVDRKQDIAEFKNILH